MPTYEYHCDSCDQNFDVVQSFHDDPLTACPTCGSPVRKVFGNVGIVFKGSGFYKTDSRAGAAKAKGTGSDADESPAAAGSDGSGRTAAALRRATPRRTPTSSGADSSTKTATPSTTTPSPAAPASSSGGGRTSAPKADKTHA